MRLNIWAICSPSAYITSPAIQNMATFSGRRPCSFWYLSMRLLASFLPTIQAASVGMDEGSREKKFLPVGRTSIFPLVTRPEGPGFMKPLENPWRRLSISSDSSILHLSSSTRSRKATRASLAFSPRESRTALSSRSPEPSSRIMAEISSLPRPSTSKRSSIRVVTSLSRSPAAAFLTWGRRMARTISSLLSPSGSRPKMCMPSGI
ncbi:MAG: hypothetical protein A4E51_01765 [Methanosaeta sp. PtaU1.Bin055]|nr:MAG: hypothetical protein A4E51_01765 [Methanosaeta sp. PtaU1.Bin055]